MDRYSFLQPIIFTSSSCHGELTFLYANRDAFCSSSQIQANGKRSWAEPRPGRFPGSVSHSAQFDRQREREEERREPEGSSPHHRRPGHHLAPGNTTESRRRQSHQPGVIMSSEAETQQQPPQPAADAESPSSPAAAASAGDKKVIGERREGRGREAARCPSGVPVSRTESWEPGC